MTASDSYVVMDHVGDFTRGQVVRKGDLFPEDRFPKEEEREALFRRLASKGLVRLASPHEAQQSTVTLPDEDPSSRTMSMEEQIVGLKAKVMEQANEIEKLTDELSRRPLTAPASYDSAQFVAMQRQIEDLSRLVAEKDRVIAARDEEAKRIQQPKRK